MDLKDLKKAQLKNTIANFVIPIVAGLLSIALVGLVIYPSLGKIEQLEKDIETQALLEAQLETKVKKLNDLTDFRASVDENSALISKALSEEPLVPQLLTQIDRIAREAGLNVARLSYSVSGDSLETASYEVVSVNLGSVSTYQQLVTFLASVENAARLLTVNNVRFGIDDETGEVSTTFILVSPYVKVQSVAATDDPITFDLSDQTFQNTIQKLKTLRVYEISLEDVQFVLPDEESDVPVVVVGTEEDLSEDNEPTTPLPLPEGAAPNPTDF